MARFLVATMPIPGHALPMQAVVRALVDAGHDVLWYGSQFQRELVQASGARFAPLAATTDYGDGDYDRHFAGRAGLRGLAQLRFDFKRLFIDPIAGYLQDLRRLQRDFAADVLVSDAGVAAAGILSEQDRLPWAVLNISVLGLHSRDVPPFGLALGPSHSRLGRWRNRALYGLFDQVLFRDVNQHYAALARQHGWPVVRVRPAVSPYLYLQPCVPGFEYPRSDLPPQVHFIGPLLPPWPQPAPRPAWWPELARRQRPVVLVTQGTVATDARQLLRPALAGLAGEDCLVLATTGGADPGALGFTPPANARVERFLPFHEVMPWVDVFVTNGGYGGVSMALAHGVPLVCAGRSEDKAEVARRVHHAGAGIDLRTATPSPRRLRQAVQQVLSQPRWRAAAQALRPALQAPAAPQAARRLLEELARTRAAVPAR